MWFYIDTHSTTMLCGLGILTQLCPWMTGQEVIVFDAEDEQSGLGVDLGGTNTIYIYIYIYTTTMCW